MGDIKCVIMDTPGVVFTTSCVVFTTFWKSTFEVHNTNNNFSRYYQKNFINNHGPFAAFPDVVKTTQEVVKTTQLTTYRFGAIFKCSDPFYKSKFQLIFPEKKIYSEDNFQKQLWNIKTFFKKIGLEIFFFVRYFHSLYIFF